MKREKTARDAEREAVTVKPQPHQQSDIVAIRSQPWRYPYYIGSDFWSDHATAKIVIGIWEWSKEGDCWKLVGHEPMPPSVDAKLTDLANQIEALVKGSY